MVQWLLEKGAEVDAKDRVRGDPMGQGDPEGVGEGLWGALPPHLERNCSSPSPGPWGGSLQGGSSVLDFFLGNNS